MIEFAVLAIAAGLAGGALMPSPPNRFRQIETSDIIGAVLSLVLTCFAITCFIIAVCTAPWGSIR